MGARCWSWTEELVLDDDGCLARRWRRVLPTIRDEYLDSVVYLYKSKSDAEEGVHTGGSGFLVGVWNRELGSMHLYVVTNRHVVNDGFSVVRMNSRSRPSVIEEVPVRDWAFHPAGDDLAVWHYRVQAHTVDQDFSFVPMEPFWITEDRFKSWFGPGDECFMVGRFITHDGHQRNLPSVRFGNIAMMPLEPFRHKGEDREAYMVETRSQAGYSGSPVFVYRRTMTTDIPIRDASAYKRTVRYIEVKTEEDYDIQLLGVDFAHVPNRVKITSSDPFTQDLLKDAKVEVGSGMLAVAPVWKLTQLLNRDDLREMRESMARKNAEEELVEEVANDPEATPGIDRTADLLGNLLQVPKDEADEVSEGR